MVVLVFAATIIQVAFPAKMVAATDIDDISWTSSAPVMRNMKTNPNTNIDIFDDDTSCQHFGGDYHTVEVGKHGVVKQICVLYGKNISIGYARNDLSFVVVGFPGDSRMYRFRTSSGSTRFDGSIVYSAGQDTLAVKVPNMFGADIGYLSLYKNFSKRVELNTSDTEDTSYRMMENNPEYGFIRYGQWYTNYWGMSKNGRYLAFTLVNESIAIMDIETMELKRVISYDVPDNWGTYHHGMFSVSNDGRHIAFVGPGVDSLLIDVNSGCGDIVNESPLSNDASSIHKLVNNPCPKRDMGPTIGSYMTKIVEYYLNVNWPSFSDDGGELMLYITSNVGSVYNRHYLTMRAANYDASRIDYLALGDSYSSGEGEQTDDYYMPGTNVKDSKCHLSSRSYPFLISARYGIDPLYTKSVACSGATTNDIAGGLGGDMDYWGQQGRLKKIIGSEDVAMKDEAQASALSDFSPGMVHQSTFANKYKPNIITIGVGGNDVGFASKLTACLMIDTCSWAETANSKAQTAVEIKGAFNKLYNAYQSVKSSSPGSTIYAVGYPRLFSPSETCSFSMGHMFDDKERAFVNEGVNYLNQVIAAAAQKAGIRYIDIESSLGEHALCGSEKVAAMNGIRTGDDIKVIWTEVFGQESFHPNAFGHKLIADKITSSIENFTSYDYCNGQTDCSDLSVVAPEPSTYWTQSSFIGELLLQKVGNFIDEAKESFNGKTRHVSLPKNYFKPLSAIKAVINSTPRSLGQFTAADDGSFSANIELPTDLEDGYHTVHLYGTAGTGEAIDSYQVIGYLKPASQDNKQDNSSLLIDSGNDKAEKTSNDAVKSATAKVDNLENEHSMASDSSNFSDWLSSSLSVTSSIIDSQPEKDNSQSDVRISNSESMKRDYETIVPLGSYLSTLLSSVVAILSILMLVYVFNKN